MRFVVRFLNIFGVVAFWLISLAFFSLAALLALANLNQLKFVLIDRTIPFEIFYACVLGLALNPLIYRFRHRLLKNGFVYCVAVFGLLVALVVALPAVTPTPPGQVGRVMRLGVPSRTGDAYWLGYLGNNFMVQDLYSSQVTLYESGSHRIICTIDLNIGNDKALERVTLNRNRHVLFAVVGNNGQTGRVVVFSADNCIENHDYHYISSLTDVRYVEMSADGRKLVLVRNNGDSAMVFDALTGKTLSKTSINAGGQSILGSVFAAPVLSPDSQFVIGVDGTHDVSTYDLMTLGRLVGPIRPGAKVNGGEEQDETVESIAASADSQMFATCTTNFKKYKSSVDLWRVSNGQKIAGPLLDSIEDNCGSLAFSPDGRYLAIEHQDGKLSVWDLTKNAYAVRLKTIFLKTAPSPYMGGMTVTIPTSDGFVTFSPDGKHLLTGSEEYVREWAVDKLVK